MTPCGEAVCMVIFNSSLSYWMNEHKKMMKGTVMSQFSNSTLACSLWFLPVTSTVTPLHLGTGTSSIAPMTWLIQFICDAFPHLTLLVRHRTTPPLLMGPSQNCCAKAMLSLWMDLYRDPPWSQMSSIQYTGNSLLVLRVFLKSNSDY